MDAKPVTAVSTPGHHDAPRNDASDHLADAVHDTIERVVECGHPALDRLAERAHEAVVKVTEVASKTAEGVQAHGADIKQVQGAMLDECREFVRDHPFKALFYVAAAGFLVTRVLRD